MGIHTLHVEHVVLLSLYTLLTVANSLMYKGMKGVHWFSLYNFMALLGAVSVELRGQIPDFTSIVLGNLFVVAGYLCLYVSLAELFGAKRREVYVQVALGVIAVVTMLQYGLIHPETRPRLVAYSAVLGLQQVQIAWLLFRRKEGKPRVTGGWMGLMLAALALANVVRIVGVLTQGAPKDYLNAGPFLAWIVIINSCLQCGAMVAYVWMTAALLRHDLQLQASTDPLTGLLNRRSFEEAAQREIAACLRSGDQLAAITLDLDGFKQINDTYGHSFGDMTLVLVAEWLRQGVRKNDLVARLGGDEFALLLPQAGAEAALEIAERLRASLREMRLPFGDGRAWITASFGMAEVGGLAMNWGELVTSCDRALYTAKRRGGDGIVETAEENARSAVSFQTI